MMPNRWMPLFGTAALLFLAGCAAEVDERWVPPTPQQSADAHFEGRVPGSTVASQPAPRRKGTAYQRWANGNAAYEKPASNTTKTAGAGNAAKASESIPASNKPLTPAEIRTAVPLEKVPNPAKTLATAKIKSVWGDVFGQVRSVDVAGGKLAAVDATMASAGEAKSRRVRIDAGRLKYVKSRNLLVTTLSKPDLDKLAKPEQP